MMLRRLQIHDKLELLIYELQICTCEKETRLKVNKTRKIQGSVLCVYATTLNTRTQPSYTYVGKPNTRRNRGKRNHAKTTPSRTRTITITHDNEGSIIKHERFFHSVRGYCGEKRTGDAGRLQGEIWTPGRNMVVLHDVSIR